jgi:hypothetical protein
MGVHVLDRNSPAFQPEHGTFPCVVLQYVGGRIALKVSAVEALKLLYGRKV